MSDIEDAAREAGFASSQELLRMTASIDLQRRGALYFFDRWKRDDGTKAGLLANFPETAPAQDSEKPWKERAEQLAYLLHVYISAHESGNAVPRHLDTEAREAVQGLADPRRRT